MRDQCTAIHLCTCSGRDHCSTRWGHLVCNPTSWSTSRSTPFTPAQSLKTQQLGIWDLWLWSLHFHLLTFASPSLSTPWSSIDLAPWNAYGKLVRWHDVLLSKWLNHLDLIKQQVDYEGQENHLGWGKEVAECRINVVTQCLGTLHEDYDLSVCHL